MTDPFIAQLAELCTAHVTRAKWVFVSSHAVGPTFGERIALSTNWLNLRLDVALRIGRDSLLNAGSIHLRPFAPALMMRLPFDLRTTAGIPALWQRYNHGPSAVRGGEPTANGGIWDR